MSKVTFSLDQDGELDEFFARGHIHVERMNDTGFWIGIETDDGERIHINTGLDGRTWFFNVERVSDANGELLRVQRPRPRAKKRREIGATGKRNRL